ncbi:MAG: tetratricopeptide repeat-containing sensor histidine kinase [Puia sp.]|nr:tetratricopeptide repeat-containing sensor histidine kinase [Puia sp.]
MIFFYDSTAYAQSKNTGSGGAAAARGVPDPVVRALNEKAGRLMFSLPDSAIFYSLTAAGQAERSGDIAGHTLALGNLGRTYYLKGSYDLSLKYSIASLELAEKMNDSHSVALEYNNIGLVYLGHEQYDLALKEFLRSLEIAGSSHDSVNLSSYLFNAGICYDHQKDYARAIDYLNKALLADKGTRVAIMSINRLGETYLHIKDYDLANAYYRKVLADSAVKDDKWEKAFACQGLAQVAYARGHFDSSILYSRQSLAFAQAISAKWDEERAAKLLAQSYAGLRQYRQAYEYQLLDQSYSDSLYDESREEVVSYLKLRREEKQNQQWQAQSGEDKKIIQLRTVLLVVASLFALLLVFILLFIYRSYNAKHQLNQKLASQNADILAKKEQIARQNEALASSNQLKDQLFSVISHDLRGPLTAMQQMLELVRTKEQTEEERDKLYDLFYRQVTQTNLMLGNLLQWVNSQRTGPGMVTKMETVDLAACVGEVLSVYGFLALQKKITIQNQLPARLSMTGDREQLKIVLQNMIGNAIKFTHPSGSIVIGHTHSDQTLSLHVKDDGVGIPREKLATLFDTSGPSHSTYGTASERGTGIGLQMVKQFVERNGGTLSIQSEEGKGTEITISFVVSGEW